MIKLNGLKKFLLIMLIVITAITSAYRGIRTLVTKTAVIAKNGESVELDKARKKEELKAKAFSISDQGNIKKEENAHFERYLIAFTDKNEYTDFNEDEDFLYINLKNVDKLSLSSNSFKNKDENVFSGDVRGKNTLVISKLKVANNYVFFNELTNTLIILVSKEDNPFKYTAVIDPGHGGVDPGTAAYDNSFNEKDITFKIQKSVKPELMYQGCLVYMTREEDKTIRVAEIIEYSKSRKPNVFVSVHINSYDKSSAYSGLQTFYSTDNVEATKSKELAQIVQKHILKSDGWKDRGVASERYYVLRMNNIPAVLIECGFASNPGDVSRLNNDEVLYNLSRNISEGIMEYLDKK